MELMEKVTLQMVRTLLQKSQFELVRARQREKMGAMSHNQNHNVNRQIAHSQLTAFSY